MCPVHTPGVCRDVFHGLWSGIVLAWFCSESWLGVVSASVLLEAAPGVGRTDCHGSASCNASLSSGALGEPVFHRQLGEGGCGIG